MAEDVVRSATCACWDCVFDPDLPGCYAKESSPSHLTSAESPTMSRPSKKIVCRVHIDEQAKSVGSPGPKALHRSSLILWKATRVADFRANVRIDHKRLLFGLVKHHEQPLDQRDPPASYRQASLSLAGRKSGTISTTRFLTRQARTPIASNRSAAVGSVTSQTPTRSKVWKLSATVSPGSPRGTSSTTRSPRNPPFAEQYGL